MTTGWFCLFALVFSVSLASTECSCSSGTLSYSFGVAHDAFSGNVLGQSNDGTALVLVTEVFKGTFSSSDLIYIRYSCGTFPVRIGQEGVFFTRSTTNVGGSKVAYLYDCTRNGAVNQDEKAQLRSGQFAEPCTDPKTGKIYSQGQSFPQDCNTCVCESGVISCTKMACNPTPPVSRGCALKSGKIIPEGASTKVDCNTCTCTNGILACTEMACAPSHCTYQGRRRENGESWPQPCPKYTCLNGQVLPKSGCETPSTTTSKMVIISVSLASVLVVIVVVSIATIIRNRMRAREMDSGILLDDVDQGSDSDGNNNSEYNHNGGVNAFSSINAPASAFPPAYGNVMGTQPMQPMVYNGWGGQPLQTTPMVLMTQTGEPVVVQVAYM